MRKLKLLLALSALIVGAGGMQAQTDVTSTYLTNANFETDAALTSTYLYGYGKDGSPYGFQTITGWTSVVTAGDNSNANYPNSGMAGGVFSYGSSTQLKGNSKAAPATNPNGEASGKCFGFFGVWSCGGYYYQNVTLAAGKYTITVPMYNQSGTQANTTYTGFFPTSGTAKTIAVNSTVGKWVNQAVTFTLADETAGQIRIGYQSTGNGSGSNPHIFIDCVKIEFTAIVVKDVLSTAISAATTANAVLSNSDLASAIATAQAVFNDEDATQEEVNAAAATLNAATELAMSAAGDVTDIFLTNANMSSTDGWTAYVSSGYRDYGNGLIGTYNVRFSAATVDATHLDSEYCFGFECRWSTNYASYYQTTAPVPAGVYEVTFDVENVNGSTTSASYNNLFYVQVGDATTTDTSTEWMQGKSSWTSHKIRVTVNEASPMKISLGYGTGSNNLSADNTPALYVSHLKLNYKSFLAGAKEAWDEAVADAEAAKTECPNVTGEELTALNAELAKAEPSTVDGYEEATADLEAATATLRAAKAAYDAYAEIRAVAEALSVAPGDAPASAAAAPAATHTLNVAVYTATTAANIFDVTEVYSPSWSDMSTSSGQHWSGDTGISYADEWRGDTNPTSRNTTVTLPSGSYILMSAGRGSANTVTTMSANGTTVTFASNGDMGLGINKAGAASFDADDAAGFSNKDGQAANTGTGWEWRFIPVTLGEETAVTVTQTLTRLSGSAWGSFSDFRILKIGVAATPDDYTALNSAISTAEAKTLGFIVGQYAPYNNVDALTKLAEAKAINQSANNEQSVVQGLTTYLNTAGNWHENPGNVDIIYNGMFDSEVEGDWGLTGWTRTNGWGQQQTGLSGDFETAYYNQPGSLQYGNQGVYTMPLNAEEYYGLTFSYRSHENNSNGGVAASVLNAEDGLAAVNFTANGSTTEWKTVTAFFKTGAAGNYVLTLANSGNTWITNVSLTSLGEFEQYGDYDEDYGIYDDPAFAEIFYPSVTLTRSFPGAYQWSTLVVPFDITNEELVDAFGVDVAVAEFSEESADANDITVNFNKMTTPAVTANKPVLVRSKASVSEIELTNKLVILRGEANAKVEGTNIDFQGIYDYTDPDDCEYPFTIPEGDYFISVNKLYKSSGATTIKPFRAYLKCKSAGARIANFNIGDDETTGIADVRGKMEDGRSDIYNLNGQRVEKAKKGLYIQNGKKVVIK